VKENIPHHGEKYLPIVGAFSSSSSSRTRSAGSSSCSPPTSNLNTTFALSDLLLPLFNAAASKEHGFLAT